MMQGHVFLIIHNLHKFNSTLNILVMKKRLFIAVILHFYIYVCVSVFFLICFFFFIIFCVHLYAIPQHFSVYTHTHMNMYICKVISVG